MSSHEWNHGTGEGDTCTKCGDKDWMADPVCSESKLRPDVDQNAFIFTARLKALCDEFDDRISLAAAIGAFEVVKHELIAEALGGER